MGYRLRIKDLREDIDMNQTEIAKKFGYSQTCISGWETGARDIPTKEIVEFAKFFNVTTDYLLGVTDERRPFPKS